MRKFILKSSVALIMLLVMSTAANFALAQSAPESITDFVTDITINTDSSILVKEKINYDFGTEQHHGIFRKIIYKYKARGGTFKYRLSDIAVTDQDGNPIQSKESKSGSYYVLTIGDPDSFVTGVKEYNITYKVQRALNYFDDHDELYWNATGTEWPVPIAKSQAIVHAPAPITKVTCYTGPKDSQDKNCSISGGNSETVTFTTSGALAADEGLTIVAGIPKGAIAEPTAMQKVLDIVRDNGILALPLLVIGIMLYIWNRFGKDAMRKNAVVAQYEAPEKMSPLYVGTLAHNGTDNKDIAAEVVYLAEQGYIKIERQEQSKLLFFKGADYEFTKLEKSPAGLAPQSKKMFDSIFHGNLQTVKLSDLKSDTTFGTALTKIKTDTMKELVKAGHYKANPTTVKALWFILAIFGTILTSYLLGIFIGYLGVIAAIASGLIVLIFSFIMPARTQKGADTVALIDGLEEYMTVAEKDRLKFHNAPEKNPQLFEKLLPFAIALGVEKQWAEQFKDLTMAPSWYTDSTGSTAGFNAAMFSNSMSNFSNSVQSAASSVTTASSGGSGFSGGGSGGGGGGGGGGSW